MSHKYEKGKKLWYKVLWKDYWYTTWEPRESLQEDVPELIRIYWDSKKKPKNEEVTKAK